MVTSLIAVMAAVAVSAVDSSSVVDAAKKYEARHPEAKRVGGSVKAPVLLKRAEPEFPDDLKKKNREASPIILEAVISETGSMDDPVVLSTANPELHPYVLEAVRKWKYQPAQENGKAVPVFIMISIQLH